jgi:hypothetical protein
MKYIAAIIGFYAIVKYVLWCNLSYALYAIDKSFSVPQTYNDITNLVIYSALAISFYVNGRFEKDIINKVFIFYAIAEFWGFLCLQIIINLIQPDAYIFKMYIVALLAVIFINFILAIYYLIIWLHKSL